MNILCIGAFSTTITIILKTDAGAFENRRTIGFKHNQVLMPLIDSILADARISPSDLSVVGCTRGPGSFTALRIVMSTAKGLAAGTGAFFISIPTFDVIGQMYAFFPGVVVPILDAKRGRFYAALYHRGSKIMEEMDTPPHLLTEKLAGFDHILFVGADNTGVTAKVKEDHRYVAADHSAFGAYLIDSAENMYKDNKKSEKEVSPLYVRLSDAELQRRNEPGL